MREQTTWIKLDRNILDWGWYKDPNTKAVFIHLLLTANIEDKMFKGEVIHRGELATSIGNLAESVGITYDQARTALNHLKETNEVTITRRAKYLEISIVNYNKYQGCPNRFPIKNGEEPVKKFDEDENSPNQIPITKSPKTVVNDGLEDGVYDGVPTHRPNQIPIKSQSNPNQIPTTKEYKNKRIKESLSLSPSPKPYQIPTLDEVKEYERESGLGKDPEVFYRNYSSTDWKANGKKIYNWQRLYDAWEAPALRVVRDRPERITDADGITYELVNGNYEKVRSGR